MPGTYLQLLFGRDFDVLHAASPKVYWRLAEVAAQGVAALGCDVDVDAALVSHLKQSIGLQMMAYVPLGAFLSSGVGSTTTMVAFMQAQPAFW